MSQSTKPHMKMEEVTHSIDPERVRKSPLTKQKILDAYADVFEGLGTFPEKPYMFELKGKLHACKTCSQEGSYPSTR